MASDPPSIPSDLDYPKRAKDHMDLPRPPHNPFPVLPEGPSPEESGVTQLWGLGHPPVLVYTTPLTTIFPAQFKPASKSRVLVVPCTHSASLRYLHTFLTYRQHLIPMDDIPAFRSLIGLLENPLPYPTNELGKPVYRTRRPGFPTEQELTTTAATIYNPIHIPTMFPKDFHPDTNNNIDQS